MKSKTKNAADFGITLTGTQLEEFNTNFLEGMYKEHTLRFKITTIISAVVMFGLCIWMTVARTTSLPVMLFMMISPILCIVLLVLSLFEKDRAVSGQYYCASAFALAIILLDTYICLFMNSNLYILGIKQNYYSAKLLGIDMRQENLSLYITCMVLIPLSIFSGMKGWAKMLTKTVPHKKESKKKNYSIILPGAICGYILAKAIVHLIDGRQSAELFVLSAVAVIMTAVLSYFLGICAGNVRYLRFLEGVEKEN